MKGGNILESAFASRAVELKHAFENMAGEEMEGLRVVYVAKIALPTWGNLQSGFVSNHDHRGKGVQPVGARLVFNRGDKGENHPTRPKSRQDTPGGGWVCGKHSYSLRKRAW